MIIQSPCGNLIPLQDDSLGVILDRADKYTEILRILEVPSYNCVAVLDILDFIVSFDVKRDRVVACNRFGSVQFFRVFSSTQYIPWTTIVRLFLVDKQAWEDRLTSLCPWCGDRFFPQDEVVDKVKKIMGQLIPGQSPCLELPDVAWDEPQLKSACPVCQKNLRFYPFIVDNS